MSGREVEPRMKAPKQPPKKRRRLPSRSAKTIDRQPARDFCRFLVLLRANGRCEYETVIPEVQCGYLDRTRLLLEVDEIRGGSYRSTEQYDPDRCKGACQKCHRVKTDHKAEIIDRLNGEPHHCLRCGFRDLPDGSLARGPRALVYPCARCQISDEMAAELEANARRRGGLL